MMSTNPMLDNPALAAGVELLNETATKILQRWPEDSQPQIEAGLKKAFRDLNLAGGIITSDALLGHYEQQRSSRHR